MSSVLPEAFTDQPLIMSVLMTPNHVNFGGRAHGGFLLKLLDEVAYVCAARYCGGYAVTAAMQQAQFLQGIGIGEIVNIYGSVDLTGRTSMEMSLNVATENPRTLEKRYVHQCFITMVAVNAAYKPVPVLSYTPKTEQEKKRYEMARIRRELLQDYRDRIGRSSI